MTGVQGRYDKDFGERMFVYNYRIFDRYRRPVATLAVLADRGKRWRPDSFRYALFGCEMGIRFPVVKLADYAGHQDSLLDDNNVFALVTVAHLVTQQSRGSPVQRYRSKWKLARLLYLRNWDKQRIIDLFSVIDWMLRIPPEMQNALLDDIAILEKELSMPYMNPFEKRGREEGARKMLETLLEQRFGSLPRATHERILHADTGELHRWGRAMLTAPTLDQVFADH